jgi:hypothetical protein
MSSLAEVVAQLQAAIEQLDAAAVTSMRAQADAEQATGHYTEAARGTEHADLRQAVSASQEAGAKSGRMARLLAQAAGHFATYVNTIAPGSIDARKAGEAAQLSGEDLVQDTVRRKDRQRRVDSYLGQAVRKSEDIQDKTKTGTSVTVRVLNALREEFGPQGTVSPGTWQDTTVTVPGARSKIDAPDTAGNLVIVGLMAGVALHRGFRRARRTIERLRDNDDQD